MSDLPQERPLLPIACTLDAGAGPLRVEEWRAVLDAVTERAAPPGSLVLTFGDRPGLGAELARLVEAEGVCCSFLGWQLERTASGWRVVISGDDEALAALPTGL